MTGKGTALRTHKITTRIVPNDLPGRPAADLNVVEVRKLLRTNMSLEQIGLQLGVKRGALRNFIKRRNLCNLTDRKHFISLQASTNREAAEAAS